MDTNKDQMHKLIFVYLSCITIMCICICYTTDIMVFEIYIK